ADDLVGAAVAGAVLVDAHALDRLLGVRAPGGRDDRERRDDGREWWPMHAMLPTSQAGRWAAKRARGRREIVSARRRSARRRGCGFPLRERLIRRAGERVARQRSPAYPSSSSRLRSSSFGSNGEPLVGTKPRFA